jgi:hypothetical protein
MFLRSEVRYDFRIKMFRLYLQLFVGGIKSGIICVCLRIVVCFCFVCLRLCQFLWIVPSVFSNVYLAVRP